MARLIAKRNKAVDMRISLLNTMIRAYKIHGVLCLMNCFRRAVNAIIDGQSLRTHQPSNAGTRKFWAAGDATAR